MKETIVLGGGCFWCIEAVFRNLKGVFSVVPGYAGGDPLRANYKDVCKGDTGHAEVIQIVFDASVITLVDVLTVFFASHDPTTFNRQGADIGEQYRSVIFYTTEEQLKVIDSFIGALQGSYEQPVVTEVAALETFYEAEPYHHDYFAQNKNAPYCQIVIAPKIAVLENRFKELISNHGE
ncbi:MAG: hypothetical protein RI911_752 [Candidatus Parcubacteria bacterium]|jgi:methionine-S-sulfoxide reductase